MLQMVLQSIIISVLLLFGFYLTAKTSDYKFIGLVLIFFGLFCGVHFICRILFHSWLNIIRNVVDCLCVLFFFYFLLVEYTIFRDSKITTDQSLEYIIVHGAKLYGSMPSPSLFERLQWALPYLQTHADTVVVLTGAKWQHSDLSEAQYMYNWLIDSGISKERLLIEEQASNTLENLRFSMKKLTDSGLDSSVRIGLLTSDYHMRRTMYLAKAEAIDAVGIAVPTERVLIRINYFIREAFAMTEIYLFGVEGI